MGNTSPDAIFFPDTIDRVGQVQSHLATGAASVQTAVSALRAEQIAAMADVYSMPGLVVSNGANVQSVTANGFNNLPGINPITIDFVRPALVLVTLGAWMVASTGDVRAGVMLTGATVQGSPVPNWGQVLYLANAGNQTHQGTIQKLVTVGAGATTFTVQAYQQGGGTKQVNYATLQVAPLRWAGPPA